MSRPDHASGPDSITQSITQRTGFGSCVVVYRQSRAVRSIIAIAAIPQVSVTITNKTAVISSTMTCAIMI